MFQSRTLYFLLMGCTELTLKTWSGTDHCTTHSSITGLSEGRADMQSTDTLDGREVGNNQ